MARTRLGNAALDVRTALAIGLGVWRLVVGRLPWQSRRDVRRRRSSRRFTRIG